jgi:maltose alpha-D-glucosyltransferase / alpha-amylase
MMNEKTSSIEENPLWFKDAIIYEVPVRAFYDGNDDGVGDFLGLKEKLGYLENLGITAIWLLPFYPSPLKDDGYDISDYFNIHPGYGTLSDFRAFLGEAHRRGIRVITELVLNHTSDQHSWFKKSRSAKPGTVWRNFYIWSDTPDKFGDARIIFKDFEASNWTWDPTVRSYYFHRFYSHQPDMNFDNPLVRRMIFRVIDFWLRMGVDGLRLDAVPYLFKREGTNCENLPETFSYLREIRAHVDSAFKDRMLLAEANQWPEDAAAYFGDGDMCHMAFHFPLMPRIFMGMQMESRFPIVDIIEQTPAIPEICQWALFLRNHDELTLEMVTDEERDYMYRVYARDPQARINLGIRRRLAPLLNNNRRRIELIYAILFSLPGTPVIYYGEEIGMGDNYYLGDRNGVRTPMQWSPDRNAGFSRTNPQKIYLPVIIDPEYHYEAVNVENQQRNLTSLLWWMKRAIAVRKGFKAPGRGTMEFLFPSNSKILAFVRTYEDERILCVANLSSYFQVVELDLSKYTGFTPETPYSQNRFPVIREAPYVLTLGPDNCLWLLLRKPEEIMGTGVVGQRIIPELRTEGSWDAVFQGKTRELLERNILPEYLKHCRWFGGKANRFRKAGIVKILPVSPKSSRFYLLFLEIAYLEGAPDTYLLPISFVATRQIGQPPVGSAEEEPNSVSGGEEITARSKSLQEEFPESIIARLYTGTDEGILYDATYNDDFRETLFSMILRKRKVKGMTGEIVGHQGRMFTSICGITAYQGRMFTSIFNNRGTRLDSQRLKADQSNTSFLYEDKFYFKLFRNLKEGVNPEVEMVRFLTDHKRFQSIPPFAGAIEYQCPDSEPVTIGLLMGFIPNQGDGWSYTQDVVNRYFDSVLSKPEDIDKPPQTPASLFDVDASNIPPVLEGLIEGHYLQMAALLGKRTAEMHLALSSSEGEEEFTPEKFSILYQKSLFQSMRTLVRSVFQVLRDNMGSLPESVREGALSVLQSEKRITDSLRRLVNTRFSATRTRIHGDYHLGQVLYTGKDFFIMDFEGEPAKTTVERRLKHSPFKDVAGMIRSFHYAAYTALLREASVRKHDAPLLRPWADVWYRYVASIFLGSYLETAGNASFIPEDKEDLNTMLKAYLLEKAIYELGYELNNRPEWVVTPLIGVQDLMEEE